MKKKYKFQIENGNLSEGHFDVAIKDYIAEIEDADITPAVEILIASKGGQLVVEKAKTSIPKARKGKKEVNDNDRSNS